MMAKKGLTNDELLAQIEREEKSAYGYYNGTLASERQTALDYYHGEPFTDDEYIPEGRSHVVDRTVAEVVESVLPQIIKVFCSGQETVKFTPVGPDDIAKAEVETACCNHIFSQQNQGFNALYDAFKDSLIQKMGYVKVWYEESADVTKSKYEGLSDDELAMLLSDDSVEAVEYEAYQEMVSQDTPQGPMEVPVTLHNVTIQQVGKEGGVKICSVPPEEIFVSMSHTEVSLKNVGFVEHRTKKTISEIRLMGYKINNDISDGILEEAEEVHRDQYSESDADENLTSPNRKVWLRDIYYRVDFDGDGIAELRRVLVVGKTILENEECDVIPFAAFCPVPASHRHVGQGYADLVMDLQEIKSMLLRQVIDNGHLALNGRYAISDRVNLDDMLVSRPGGVVRVEGEPGSAIMPLNQISTSGEGLQLLEYSDSVRESRTGVTRYQQGMDANSLNKTATGIQQIMSMAQARIELVCRIYAEVGMRDLFALIHHHLLTHEKHELMIELRGQWIPVNPQEWKKRTSMTIAVGLGTGNKDQQLMHLGNMFQMSLAAAQAGVVTPTNIYNILKELATNAGFRDADKFFTDPSRQPPQQPQPDPRMMVEQAKLQADVQKSQAQMQLEAQKAEAQMQQEQLRSSNDVQIEREKLAMQAELERYKAQLKAETDVMIARMNAEIESQKNAAENAQEMRKTLIESEIQLKGLIEQAKTAQGNEQMGSVMSGLQAMIESLNRPKSVIRGADGRVAGIQ